MNIKSNSKKKGPSFLKSAWLGFIELIPNYGVAVKLAITMICISLAVYTWSYSGVISLFFIMIILAFTITPEYGTVHFPERLFWVGLIAGVSYLFGSMNTYSYKTESVKLEYSKLTFVDSTEKIVAFVTSPTKETIVFTPSATNYYTIKEHQNDINISVKETGEYDHWSYLDKNLTKSESVEEWNYKLTMKTPDAEITQNYSNGTSERIKLGQKDVK